MVNNALLDIRNGLEYRVNFAELIYQVAIKDMQTLRSQTIKKNKVSDNLQLFKEFKTSNKLKKKIKRMNQPKKILLVMQM